MVYYNNIDDYQYDSNATILKGSAGSKVKLTPQAESSWNRTLTMDKGSVHMGDTILYTL